MSPLKLITTVSIAAPGRDPATPTLTLSSYELVEDLGDSSIVKELNKDDRLNEPEFLICIEWMICGQLNGEEGYLLNNGHPNLFYLPDYVHDVRWEEAFECRQWNIRKWKFDDDFWRASARVFALTKRLW